MKPSDLSRSTVASSSSLAVADVGPSNLSPAARQKVAFRLLPFIFSLYVVAYLDRANLSFAKLGMAGDLNFSEQVFGDGIGIFFIGYLLLELPGALLVQHWSARKWFARILITWGCCAVLMAFVHTPNQFYLVRFLLGVSEAGFFPGVIIYLTHWFTQADRAKALSGLIMAVPFSLTLGAPVSSLLVQVRALGLAGWQWMFILEGLPAVVLGIVTLFYLPDHPRDAKWLSREAQEQLSGALESEKIVPASSSLSHSFRHVLTQRTVWLLALGIFCTNVGGYALVFWLPTTIQHLSGGTAASAIAFTTLPYGLGLFAAWWSGRSSDKSGDRKWHCVAGQTGTAVFLALSAIPGQPFALVMSWLALSGFAAFFWGTPFWALPTIALAPSAAAIAVGMINIFANLAGFVGSPIIGRLRDHGLSAQNCLLLLAACYLIGAVLIALVPVRRAQNLPVNGPG